MLFAETIKSNAEIKKSSFYFFYSDYCPYCKKVKPYVDNLAKHNFKVTYCNLENCSEECLHVLNNLSINYIPALVIFDNKTEVLIGVSKIKNKVEKILNETQ